MPPRYFGDNSTRLPAFLDNARVSFHRPPAPSADTRNHLDPLQTFRSALSTLKRLVVRNTKSMLVHGRTMAPPKSGWKVGRDNRLRLSGQCPNLWQPLDESEIPPVEPKCTDCGPLSQNNRLLCFTH